MRIGSLVSYFLCYVPTHKRLHSVQVIIVFYFFFLVTCRVAIRKDVGTRLSAWGGLHSFVDYLNRFVPAVRTNVTFQHFSHEMGDHDKECISLCKYMPKLPNFGKW